MHQLEQVGIVPASLADDVDDNRERGRGQVGGGSEVLSGSRVVRDKVLRGRE